MTSFGEKNDYAALLAKAGLLLQKANPGKAWAGRIGGLAQRGRSGEARTPDNPGFAVTVSTLQGTPLYDAGIDAGDVILTADGKAVNDAESLTKIIAAKHPGDHLTIAYQNRSGEHKAELLLQEDPTLEVITFEKAGKTLNPEQETFRKKWLSTKVKS